MYVINYLRIRILMFYFYYKIYTLIICIYDDPTILQDKCIFSVSGIKLITQ